MDPFKYHTFEADKSLENEADMLKYMHTHLQYIIHKITATSNIREVLLEIKPLREKCPNLEEIIDLFERNRRGRPDSILEKNGDYYFAEFKLNNDSLSKAQYKFLKELSKLSENVCVFHAFSDLPKLSMAKPKIKEKVFYETIDMPQGVMDSNIRYVSVITEDFQHKISCLDVGNEVVLHESKLSKKYRDCYLCSVSAIKEICTYHSNNFPNEKMIIYSNLSAIVNGLKKNMWYWRKNDWKKQNGNKVYGDLLWRHIILMWDVNINNWWVRYMKDQHNRANKGRDFFVSYYDNVIKEMDSIHNGYPTIN